MASELTLNLPEGFYHAQMLFTGVACPNGAALTFGGQCGGLAPDTVASLVNTQWNTHLKSVFPADVTHAGTRVKVGPMSTGAFALVAASVAGTFAAVSVTSPNVTFLIRKNSGIGGRQGSGRMYMPGVPENKVGSDGSVDSAHRTALGAAWTAFYNALDTAGIEMFLIHSHGSYQTIRDGALATKVVAPMAPTLVTSLSVDAKAATQRRRMR